MAEREFVAVARELMARPAFAGARFGIDARDVKSGDPLFQHNARDIFPGASTTKVPTAVYAIGLLGADFRFRTKLVRSGTVDSSGTLHGDLILVASGDPNLSGRVTADDKLDFEDLDHCNMGSKAQLVQRNPLQVIEGIARRVREGGIRRVTGTVLIDVHLFAEGYREPGTGTTVSPVAVNDNQIDVEVTAGAKPGDRLSYRLWPRSGYVRFIDSATTGAACGEPDLRFSSEQRDADGTWSVTITGTVPAGTASMASFAVGSPSRFARTVLVEALAAAGVVVEGGLFGPSITTGQTTAESPVVAEHISPPLSEATKVMLKVSQNLHAEMMIPLLGATLKGARGADALAEGYACGADLLVKWGVDTTGSFQGDACGALGHFSPEFMSRLLVRIAASDIYEPLSNGLPIMGRDGTLWDIQRESRAVGHVRAKTGTLYLEDPLRRTALVTCKALAGYVAARSGRPIAFTLYLSNLHQPRSSDIVPGQVLGELASAIYEHL